MKKYFLLSLKCLLLLAIIIGCSALQVKREVHENTFVSSIPNVNIKVSPEYTYVGNPKNNDSATTKHSSYEYRTSRDTYCFIKPGEDQVEKAVLIQIYVVDTYFRSDFFSGAKNVIGKGTKEFKGKNFQYFTRSVVPSMNGHLTKHITEQGYKMPFGLIKTFGRIYGGKGNILVKIYYYEGIENSEFDERSWKNADELTQKQIDYLRNFDERAKSAFELMS